MIGDTTNTMDTQNPDDRHAKRRKLRHPRTSKACQFCRKRKVRCSGTFPCDYCVREDNACEFNFGLTPNATKPLPAKFNASTTDDLGDNQRPGNQRPITGKDGEQQLLSEKTRSRRSSLEPPQSFVEGQHLGPTSGVSFLYHSWYERTDPTQSEERDCNAPAVPLVSYGDYPQHPVDLEGLTNVHVDKEKVDSLLERYFRFATPTYRFFHQPTLQLWAKLLAIDDHTLVAAKKACVLIACAQSSLYTKVADRYGGEKDEDLKLSQTCFEKAKWFLDRETGPATLVSVQARLAMCLYLLSTFRINECRFAFSFAATIITTLGLHRRQSTSSSRMNTLESESRRRAFWCAYILDGYLGVMLGRPRLFREEDIDQPYPLNIDDSDLTSSESSENLPQHGNLEAFIAHAKLAKLMAKNSDLMYPLYPLTEEQVFQRTSGMLDALQDFQSNLPAFLRPRNKTLTGQRTFERQNTVLKLACAHVCILATRRCLLIDISRLGRVHTAPRKDPKALRAVQQCVAAMTTIIDAACSLIENESFYQSYWYTQYISIVAISTFYVFVIQGVRNGLPEHVNSFVNFGEYINKAKQCQNHLASLAPHGSQAKIHYRLLDQLRLRAERDFARKNRQPQTSALLDNGSCLTETHAPSAPNAAGQYAQTPIGTTSLPIVESATYVDLSPENGPVSSLYDPTSFSQFTPASDYDMGFQNEVEFGWQNFDMIGFTVGHDGLNFSFG